MSINGRFTGLELNLYSSLLQNQGLTINPEAAAYHGTWDAGTYTAGSIVNTTVIKKLTDSLPLLLANYTTYTLSITTWRNLLTIGAGVCPALGNSRPSTFEPTYAGFGSWQYSSLDPYGNVQGPGPLSKTDDDYPPRNYGAEKTYSYIFQERGDYAWITGWPGRNSWQKTTDDFAAAYPPGITDTGLIDYDVYFSNGFLSTVAQQAYYEFWYNYATRRPNQYAEFLNCIQNYYEFAGTQNREIASFTNNQTYLLGNFSNINDVTTSDISGVNLAFRDFGNDLIRLGKSIDLQNIHVFGLPSKLLINLNKNNALTDAVKFGLVYNDLSTTELIEILTTDYLPTPAQEKKIYDAFLLVQGQDLHEVKIILNCATEGLTSLADLLNPQRMFPISYPSLTIPTYTTEASSSKLYKLIYLGTEVNPGVQNWGEYLVGILPDNLAQACGAFMMTMNQIKNIRSMDFEKFAQVVSNLEVTDKNLPLIKNIQITPGNRTLSESALNKIAFGSGNSGSYNYCDFLGAMSGVPYTGWYQQIQNILKQIATPTLTTIYNNIYNIAAGIVIPPGGYDVGLQTLINSANAEIAAIAANNSQLVSELNYYWGKVGQQLAIEQRAIAMAIKSTSYIYENTGKGTIEGFVRALPNYSFNTGNFEIATILEKISDITNTGGQSLIAAMRENRNSERIIRAGGEVDSSVPDEIDLAGASARATVVNGQISSVTVTHNGTNYNTVLDTTRDETGEIRISRCECCEPNVQIYPQGGVFGGSGSGAQLQVEIDETGAVSNVIVTDPGSGYDSSNPPLVYIEVPPPPIRLGEAIEPGSFAGSPYTGEDPVSDNLIAPPGASYTVPEAQALVA